MAEVPRAGGCAIDVVCAMISAVTSPGSSLGPGVRGLSSPGARLTAAGIAAVTLVYAILVWDHRWIADDGLIVVRTVREILAGNGPVYSPFERAEASTSTAWLWLLAGCGWIVGGNVARLAVGLGGLLSVAGLVVALDATRRFHRDRGHAGVLVPVGVLVVLAVFPFWDYATSGLETGLGFFWLAAIWWLLVTLRPDSRDLRLIGFAVVVGLGPLVRPDFMLATTVFLIAGWQIARPPWRRALGLCGAACCVPLAYEIFRAGYYGALVPLPALAKSATASEWSRGVGYLIRFVKPHLLYVPLAVLAAAVVLERRTIVGRSTVVLAAPAIAAVLVAAFVVRVGGDFMHARLLLPSTLLIIAPTLLLPAGRVTTGAALALTAWALVIGSRVFTRTRPVFQDERAGYLRYTGQPHPTSEADYIDGRAAGVASNVRDALRDGRRFLLSEAGDRLAMNPALDAPVAIAMGHLGIGGMIAPVDGIVVDTFGLANPLGARIVRTQPGKTGHEKSLPWAWVLADFADLAVATPDISRATIDAARHAMSCGELAELLASVREPMTAARFWANLTGALRRTRLVIPADPVEAEHQFCP